MTIYAKLWIMKLMLFDKRNQNLMYGNTMSYLGFTKQTREAVWKMDGSGGRDDGALSDASGRKTVK